VRQAGKKTPFKVTETDFFQFLDFFKNTLQMKKVTDVGKEIVRKDIKLLHFTKGIGMMYYEDSLVENSEFIVVCCKHRGKGHN
jgi:hypothetical protein